MLLHANVIVTNKAYFFAHLCHFFHGQSGDIKDKKVFGNYSRDVTF